MCEKLTSRRALPSLNSLRAFEVMARTGSATLAAQDLSVTHGAVSRQVKALEAAMGVRLFEGPRHRLRLTPAGRDLSAGLTPAFDALDAAVRQVRGRAQIHLAIHPSLAVKWLIPRLPDLSSALPEADLELADLAPQAMRLRGADLAVRILAPPTAEAADVDILAENWIGVVHAPSVAMADDLPRLVAATHPQGWRDWTAVSGRPPVDGPLRRLEHLHFVVDAAVAGLGVAVLPWIVVADDVRAGRLTAPFGFVRDGGVVAALRQTGEPTMRERRLIRWLKTQAPPAP
ncbi:LysR family transcriptional regulator [Brevundimonas sp. SORGH_AS_0993]|uniref:LysR family transcriptional regulator n=1 Tax=Brevundimonas sp. SORGH_AS_0993 TaxID=3041794 RepID=UPI002781F3DA|nr:LysR family transcriptional regulator [Brevundimonas sp. SORGH_AS_0993]MDQ1155458.1 LysR family glycine cleavage system transcriptional activator [Brevundimonas sp. SORGH_AS_0993]